MEIFPVVDDGYYWLVFTEAGALLCAVRPGRHGIYRPDEEMQRYLVFVLRILTQQQQQQQQLRPNVDVDCISLRGIHRATLLAGRSQGLVQNACSLLNG